MTLILYLIHNFILQTNTLATAGPETLPANTSAMCRVHQAALTRDPHQGPVDSISHTRLAILTPLLLPMVNNLTMFILCFSQ